MVMENSVWLQTNEGSHGASEFPCIGEVARAVPPHPSPLSLGDGASGPVSARIVYRLLLSKPAKDHPLRRREGRGEGEQRVRIARCSKTEMRAAGNPVTHCSSGQPVGTGSSRRGSAESV